MDATLEAERTELARRLRSFYGRCRLLGLKRSAIRGDVYALVQALDTSITSARSVADIQELRNILDAESANVLDVLLRRCPTLTRVRQ